MSDDYQSRVRAGARTLAGANVLQIIPALREGAIARTAVDVAHALLQWGARALIAAEGGPLVNELSTAGAEWIPLANDTLNPWRLRNNARVIEQLIAFERVDLVHAHGVGAAWSARLAARRIVVWRVTTLPDVPAAGDGLERLYCGALAQADRVIAPSAFAAAPVMKRYRLPPDRLIVIPRSIDTARFDPAAIRPQRAALLRRVWRVGPADRVVLIPGRVAPWNGQLLLPKIARFLVEHGVRDFVLVLAGEHHSDPHYARSILDEARTLGVEGLLRLAGHCPDLPSTFAAADVVAVTAAEPPVLGRVVAQAQAMGRPVVTADVGNLAEHVVAAPPAPETLRTGWAAAAGDPADFAHCLAQALALDIYAYRAMAMRAREFAESAFSPASVAVATREVYTSLLARNR